MIPAQLAAADDVARLRKDDAVTPVMTDEEDGAPAILAAASLAALSTVSVIGFDQNRNAALDAEPSQELCVAFGVATMTPCTPCGFTSSSIRSRILRNSRNHDLLRERFRLRRRIGNRRQRALL